MSAKRQQKFRQNVSKTSPESLNARIQAAFGSNNQTFMEQCSAFFLRDYFKRDKGLNFIRNASSRHTRVTELKVGQLTLLDNNIFTENIRTFDERKVKKDLTLYATLLQGIQELLN